MEVKRLKEKISSAIKKYKYVVAIALIGLVLILLPSENPAIETINTDAYETNNVDTVAKDLAQILSKVDNAGEVEVFLTIESGEITHYQTDDDITTNEDGSTTQVRTVLITGSERNEYGLVRQVNPPIYKGAIVVCQGAEDPKVRLAIVNAVANVTGLGASRISVLKMK